MQIDGRTNRRYISALIYTSITHHREQGVRRSVAKNCIKRGVDRKTEEEYNRDIWDFFYATIVSNECADLWPRIASNTGSIAYTYIHCGSCTFYIPWINIRCCTTSILLLVRLHLNNWYFEPRKTAICIAYTDYAWFPLCHPRIMG